MTTLAVASTCTERALELLEQRDAWLPRVRFDPDRRWYERITADADHEAWLLSWLPGESTGYHDHARSWGAFAVALGTLQEKEHTSVGTVVRTLGAGETRSFAPGYIHDVRNVSSAPAVSIHVYSPRLEAMNRYEICGGKIWHLHADEASEW